MSAPIVHKDSEELVKNLKKCLKPYKSQIKANTDRKQRFPFVQLKKFSVIDECAVELSSNDDRCDESLDRRLRKFCRKYGRSNLNEEPIKKRSKVVDTVIDLNAINNENEDLDFEGDCDTQDSGSGDKTVKKIAQTKQVNGFTHKVNGLSSNNCNSYNRTKDKKSLLPLSGNFKIPKKNTQSIETIISHVNNLTKRPSEALNYLNKYLTEDQWNREDVVETLLNIAKNMVAFKEFGSTWNEFNELINKLKTMKYIESDFWDELIFAVDRKKNDIKNTHGINDFLAGLYDYMTEYNITARVVCTEAVVIAYRVITNHLSVKDLAEL